jgi:hypothetical protein
MFDVGLAVVVIAVLLAQRPMRLRLWWSMTMVVAGVLTMALARLASLVYRDPRRATTIHIAPLAPVLHFLPHLTTNSFPAGHAVLTAFVVMGVLFLSVRWTIPFIIMGALDVWMRVGLGWSQVIDILGGWVITAAASAFAFPVGAVLTAIVLQRLDAQRLHSRHRARHSAKAHYGRS